MEDIPEVGQFQQDFAHAGAILCPIASHHIRFGVPDARGFLLGIALRSAAQDVHFNHIHVSRMLWLQILPRCLTHVSSTQANIDKIMVLAFAGTFLSSLVVGFLLAACWEISLLLKMAEAVLISTTTTTACSYMTSASFLTTFTCMARFCPR